MGRNVLSSSLEGDTQALFSAHAWCSADTAPGAGPGAVTLAYTNAYTTPVSVTLAGASGGAYALSPRSEFFLTGDSLTDFPVYLNEPEGGTKPLRDAARLRVNRDGSLPPQLASPTGRLVSGDDAAQLVVPPQSYGFVVLHAAGASACPGPQAGAPAATSLRQSDALRSRTGGAVAAVALVSAASLAFFARRQTMQTDNVAARAALARDTKHTYGSLL